MAPTWSGKRIVGLQLYRQIPGVISWEHIPFITLYLVVLYWVSQVNHLIIPTTRGTSILFFSPSHYHIQRVDNV